MSFKQLYIESQSSVFVVQTEDGFEVIDNDDFEIVSDKTYDVESDARNYAISQGWDIVDKDPEWDELNGLSPEDFDELEFSDYGDSLNVDDDENESLTYEDGLLERLVRKRVVRNNKRILKIVSDRPGYRVAKVNGIAKEVRMKPQEMRRRKRAQRIGSRKRKAKSQTIQRKRKRSLKRSLNK